MVRSACIVLITIFFATSCNILSISSGHHSIVVSSITEDSSKAALYYTMRVSIVNNCGVLPADSYCLITVGDRRGCP